MFGFWRSAAALASQRAESRELWLGDGRPELDLLGYAPRSQRLAQLLGGANGRSHSHCVCLDCTAPGTPSVLHAASFHPSTTRSGPSPLSGKVSLPKDFMPGRSRDLIERLDVFSRNVVERPIELLLVA